MRINIFLSAIMIMLLLTACSTKVTAGTDSEPADGSADNTAATKVVHEDISLLGKAAPQSSALEIYRFDGENTIRRTVFDEGWKDKVINAVNSLKLTPADENEVTGWTEPCYGISIGDTDGMEIWLTYSNGLWIEKGGALYRGELDLETFFDEAASLDRTLEYSFESGISMPNSAILAKHFIKYCLKATGEEVKEKDGISLRFVSIDGNKVTVEYKNDSDREYLYGDYFHVDKNVDGEWYQLPVALSNYGFNDIAHILPAGGSAKFTGNLTMYGELENGRYRVVKENLYAEFAIGADSDTCYDSDWTEIEVCPAEGSYASIALKIPQDWNYEVAQSEDVPVSDLVVSIYPKEHDEGSVSIEYLRGFGVCGTGLVSEEIEFNGLACKAWRGTYDNHPYWDFISLGDEYHGCAIINNAGTTWFNDYKDVLDKIISTVRFTMVD